MKSCLFALATLCACAPERDEGPDRALTLRLTPQPSETSVRLQAVSLVDEDVVWVSGLEGTYARTLDGGARWQVGIVEGAEDLQFRDVHGVDGRTAYLLSAGSGESSRIYKTTDGGEQWELQFVNDEPQAFYDCFDFWDAEHGIAFSDSVEGELVLLATSDGEHWHRLPSDALPAARPGEGGFAASGTCVTVQGDKRAYVATGAGSARLLRTSDRGATWEVFDTPVASDRDSAGLTSVAFWDENRGMVAGGDITAPESAQTNVAVTSDGGESFRIVSSPGFSGAVYGVAAIPGTAEPAFVAVGPKGAAYTLDFAVTWTLMSGASHWSLGFAPSGRGFLVGPDGRIQRIDLQ